MAQKFWVSGTGFPNFCFKPVGLLRVAIKSNIKAKPKLN